MVYNKSVNIDTILNYENSSKNKWCKNYFFAGTLFIIALTCICYFALSKEFAQLAANTPFLNLLLSAFRHSDGMHLFGNTISLLWLGLFFENKIGSLKFVAMFFAFIFLGNGICAIYYYSIGRSYQYIFGGVGGSSANYAMFGFFLFAVIFNFKKYMLRGKTSIFNWVCFGGAIFFFLIVQGLQELVAHSLLI